MSAVMIWLAVTMVTCCRATHHCIHDDIKGATQQSNEESGGDDSHRVIRSVTDNAPVFCPIRIHVHYENLEVELFDNEILFLKQAFKDVTTKIQNILSGI